MASDDGGEYAWGRPLPPFDLADILAPWDDTPSYHEGLRFLEPALHSPVDSRPPYHRAAPATAPTRRPPLNTLPPIGPTASDSRDPRRTAASSFNSNWPPLHNHAHHHARRVVPPASHSEDWLDHRAAEAPNQFAHFPDHIFVARSEHSDRTLTSDDNHEEELLEINEDEADHFVTLEDSSSEDEDGQGNDMAPRRRQCPRPGVVDLTAESSPPPAALPRQPRGTKRTAEASASQERASKRSKLTTGVIEELDLTNEAPLAEEELLQAQQQAAIKDQQAREASGQQRIGQRSCIICMENYTNCTATSCGHFYCHECLTQALIAGERASERSIGNCPVCRKPLSRTKGRKNDIIPISFMKKETFEKAQKGAQRQKNGTFLF